MDGLLLKQFDDAKKSAQSGNESKTSNRAWKRKNKEAEWFTEKLKRQFKEKQNDRSNPNK